MLSKLFRRKGKPTKQGSKLSISQTVKTFSLELSNMEDTPSYELTGNLTIGSELGDIVLSDPSISPRHCSFTLQDDVVSVIDHGSMSGTIVKDKKIQPGRYIILEEGDVVMVGDLQVKLNVSIERIEAEEDEEEIAEEDEEEGESDEDEDEDEDEVRPAKKVELDLPKQKNSSQIPRPKVLTKYESKKKKNKTKKSVPSYTANYSTNAIIRVISVISDLILAYILFVILYPFDEYRVFLEDMPKQVGDLLEIDFKHFWDSVIEDYGFIASALEDGYQLINETVKVAPILINFFLIRFISTIMLSVSISEGMFGVRSIGNGIWNRIGGALRVIIGMFTWPLVILDIPAIVSRRTFKEFITFTHTHLSSTFYAIVGMILYFPLVIALFLVAPLFQGMDLPEPVIVNDRLDQRIKTISPSQTTPEAPGEEKASTGATGTSATNQKSTESAVTGTPEVSLVRDQGQLVRMEIGYSPMEVSMIPDFKFTGQGKKMTFTPQLEVYHKDLQRSVTFEVLKRFNLRELLSHGIGGNFFLFDNFPEIYSFVYANQGATTAFKTRMTETSIRKFADEVVSFTKLSFELDINNALDTMTDYTPLLKSLVDYKSSFSSLLEYKDFDTVGFMKVGSTYFLKFSYLKQKPFDICIPLIPVEEGIMYKVQFDKKDNIGAISNKFYKYTLDNTGWMPSKETQVHSDTLTPLQVLDFFSKLNLKDPKMSPQMAQSIYGYYFETAAEVLKSGDDGEYANLKSAVSSIFKIIEIISEAQVRPNPPTDDSASVQPPTETTIPEEDSREKLKQNFRDLKNAVDSRNRSYFGLGQNSVVKSFP